MASELLRKAKQYLVKSDVAMCEYLLRKAIWVMETEPIYVGK